MEQDTVTRDIQELFDRCYKKAYRAAKAVCFSAADAEDAVAEALVRLWKAAKKDAVRVNAEGFFLRAAVNEAIRIAGRRKEVPVEQIEEYCSAGYTERDRLVEREMEITLLRAVNSLGPKLGLPVKLVYYGGFRENEAAEYLGISYSALKTRLHRARRRLKEILERDETGLRGEYHEI